MEFLLLNLTVSEVTEWEAWLENWGFVVFGALFVFEMLRLAIKKTLHWNIVGDAVTNFVSLGLFLLTTGIVAAAYVSGFYWIYLNFALFEIEVTPLTVLLLVVLCDLAYYWEHRFVHRVGIGWATHTVHHSSPYFNISVAYRFGPFDGYWPFFFHAPLALLGFDPVLIFACEAFVQLYQTVLHTEVVGKLPRFVEAVMNTPSHHRVHHGSNKVYLDKNYGGIFIIWDRMFGTFAEKKEPVVYGLTEPIRTLNPFMVFCHGFVRLYQRAAMSPTLSQKIYAVVAPPEWQPTLQEADISKGEIVNEP